MQYICKSQQLAKCNSHKKVGKAVRDSASIAGFMDEFVKEHTDKTMFKVWQDYMELSYMELFMIITSIKLTREVNWNVYLLVSLECLIEYLIGPRVTDNYDKKKLAWPLQPKVN